MRDEEIWVNLIARDCLFESKPGTFTLVDKSEETAKILGRLVMRGFVFEVRPKQYKIVDPVPKGHIHHFVCECGAEE